MPKTPAGLWNVGTFVEWVDEGVTRQGLIVNYSSVEVFIKVSPSGTPLIVHQKDPSIREIDKPEDWEELKTERVEEPVTRAPRVPLPGGESKAAKAMEIYKSMMVDGQHPKRSEVIKAFMEQLQMTQAGASTYQHNCKKALSQ